MWRICSAVQRSNLSPVGWIGSPNAMNRVWEPRLLPPPARRQARGAPRKKLTVRVASPRALPLTMAQQNTGNHRQGRRPALAMPPHISAVVSSACPPRSGSATRNDMNVVRPTTWRPPCFQIRNKLRIRLIRRAPCHCELGAASGRNQKCLLKKQDVAHLQCRARSLRRQLREGLGDDVDELLGSGFFIGGAALVVLEVAEGGLGVGLRAVQEVSPTGRSGLSPGSLEVH